MKQNQLCEYTYEFPVDEWGRVSGWYSLADMPIKSYKKLTRKGSIVARDKEEGLYEIDDDEKSFSIVVPFDDVKIIEG